MLTNRKPIKPFTSATESGLRNACPAPRGKPLIYAFAPAQNRLSVFYAPRIKRCGTIANITQATDILSEAMQTIFGFYMRCARFTGDNIHASNAIPCHASGAISRGSPFLTRCNSGPPSGKPIYARQLLSIQLLRRGGISAIARGNTFRIAGIAESNAHCAITLRIAPSILLKTKSIPDLIAGN